MFFKNLDMKLEKELIKKLTALQKESANEHYKKVEENRILFIKDAFNFSDDEIIKNEELRKIDLFNWLLKYKNKEKYIKLCTNDINLKYLDLIREYLNLDNESISSLNNKDLIVFKEISNKAISLIPKKIVKDYNEKGITKENYLFFLQTHEYLKQR